MKPSPEQVAAIVREVYDAPLDPAEFDRRVAAALADEDEQAEIAKLIAWFTRQYPTVESRLRYARRHTPRRP